MKRCAETWAVILLCTLTACSPSLRPPPRALSHVGSRAGARDPAARATVVAALEQMRAHLAEKSAEPLDEPDKAAEFWAAQRLPQGASDVPLELLHDAALVLAAREAPSSGRAKAGAGAARGILGWRSIGPGNVGGRTRALVIDPRNPLVMYAGGVSGGVWKTTDGGAQWNPTDDQMANLAVATLAMDPRNPDVIYAGTGEGFLPGALMRGLGIFKTVNAGATWFQLPATVSPAVGQGFYWVNKIVVSPNDSNRLYAGTRHGVWRSLDAGQSWTLVLANPTYATGPRRSNGSSTGCTDMAVRSDRDPDVIFASFGSFDPDGLFRSDNGGDTWFAYTTPSYQGRMSIAIAPSNNDVVYIAMADNGGLYGLGRIDTVLKATDGRTFVPVLDRSHPFGPWLMSYVSIATGCVASPVNFSQGWYDNVIAVDPMDPDILWLGGSDLYRSNDGGRTFGLAAYWFYFLLDPRPPSYIHPDQHGIVFHPSYDGASNQTMYVTNDGGMFRTTNARAATSQEECPTGSASGPPPEIEWETLNHGYGVTQFYDGEAVPGTDLFFGGAQDNGSSLVRSTRTPDGWQVVLGGDGGYVAVDPRDPRRMYAEIQYFPEIRRSTDGGATFTLAVNGITDTDGLFIAPFVMDPRNPDVLWTGGSRPWRTTDGARSWQLVGPDFAGPGTISAVAVAPANPGVVYLGFDNGYVVRSTTAADAMPSWQVVSNGLPRAWMSSIAVEPANPDVAYATYSTYGVPHVWRTTDGGQSWRSIDGSGATGIPDIPAHSIAVRACNPSELYVGTELGVFASVDAGATWQPANEGLAHTAVEALDFRGTYSIAAFTHGRGAFVADLGPCGTEPGEASPTKDTSRRMLATRNGATGAIEVTYSPACNALDHRIHHGPLPIVGALAYSGVACSVGTSGAASFDPGPGSSFFVVAGSNGLVEGSYGTGSMGTERPAHAGTTRCDIPQVVGGCE